MVEQCYKLNLIINFFILQKNVLLEDYFLSNQLITYLGNKRALLPFINSGIEIVKQKLNKNKLKCLDGFAGSGVVSRLLKQHSNQLFTNDLEKYSYIVNKCYLSNKSEVDCDYLHNTIDLLNNLPLEEGFITKNYAPKDDNKIKEGERVFYTHKNAMKIDTMRTFTHTHTHTISIPCTTNS